MVEHDLRATELAEGDRQGGLSVPAPRRHPAHLVVIGAALVAAALSALYVVAILRGGPRIVDATTYLLEARALAGGLLAWDPGEPSASVAGRFLVRDALADGTRLAGIFPPGWPAVLALFVAAGAPMASGPVLAALVTLATAWLGAEVARALPASFDERARAVVAPGAAAVSAVCACLRYHTADTMSHGLSAVLLAVALAGALRARRDPRVVIRLAIGLALGWLVATRPVSGVAVALLAGAIVPRRSRDQLAVVLGALPGLALLVAHQRAATGAWLFSSQDLYYRLADGPPGCFRYGLGDGIGCLHEHGGFVAANLPDGYGPLQAIATSLRRLKAHLVDPLNAEPLLLVVLVGGVAAFRARPLRAVALAPVALLLAYAPFYFDGNYPGGGARFLADALPVEHVLAVIGGLAVAARVRWLAARPPSVVAAGLVGLAVLGAAVRARADHILLRDREGGRPMYEPGAVAAAGVTWGIVFVETDHGLAIGHDPAARADRDVVVLRRLGDALDRMAWEERGRPPSYLYALSTLADGELAHVEVTPWEPPPSLRLEGESLWPVARATGASAWPRWAQGTCASAGRWLGVTLAAGGSPPADGEIEVDLPLRLAPAGSSLAVRVHRAPGVAVEAALLVDGVVAASSALAGSAPPRTCEVLPPLALPVAPARTLRLRLRGRGDPSAGSVPDTVHVALDAVEVAGPAPPPEAPAAD